MARLESRFREIFGDAEAVHVVRAPGRVNLIGEHTDYNGGFVMPMALDMSIRVALVPHDEPTVSLWSEQFGERAEFPLDRTDAADAPHWLLYPMKVAEVLTEEGLRLRGFKGVVDGDVPIASGLSSSSASTMASMLALLVAARPDVPPGPSRTLAEAHGLSTRRLAELGQKAEHRVGVLGGIMDQFVSLHGRAGHAILLDCRDLSYEAIPLPTDRAKVVIVDSAVPRRLTQGAYNERRRQCEEGVGRLRKFDADIRELRDVSWELFEAHQESLPPVIRRRCRHVITENDRVLESAEALRRGDLVRFGELLSASHDSLREDYEVSRAELDLLVGIARGIEGVLGSRLTGAGFGGCTVTLARPEAVDPLKKATLREYPKQTGLEPRIWVSEAAPGAAIEA